MTIPWIEEPKESFSEEIKTNFSKWKQASFKLYPTHILRRKEDIELIDEAVNILTENYKDVKREFQHGHFGTSDLLKTRDGQAVILSNLYWSWKPPFYDAVFGYSWFIYHLAKLKNVTPKLVEGQRNLWLSKINSLVKTEEDRKLLNLALLERAAACLNLDALSVDINSPITEYLVKVTRDEIKRLIMALS